MRGRQLVDAEGAHRRTVFAHVGVVVRVVAVWSAAAGAVGVVEVGRRVVLIGIIVVNLEPLMQQTLLEVRAPQLELVRRRERVGRIAGQHEFALLDREEVGVGGGLLATVLCRAGERVVGSRDS